MCQFWVSRSHSENILVVALVARGVNRAWLIFKVEAFANFFMTEKCSKKKLNKNESKSALSAYIDHLDSSLSQVQDLIIFIVIFKYQMSNYTLNANT